MKRIRFLTKSSIFSRLLSRGIPSIVLVSLGILAGLAFFRERSERAYEQRYQCGLARTKLIEARLYFAKYLAEDLDEPETYAGVPSSNLANLQLALAALHSSLKKVKASVSSGAMLEINQALNLAKEYEELIAYAHQLLIRRGYGDWGLEGELRRAGARMAQALPRNGDEYGKGLIEAFLNLKLAERHVLLNREHLQPEYIQDLQSSLKQVKELARAHPEPRDLLAATSSYAATLEKYRQIQMQLGHTQVIGLSQDLENKTQLLQETLEILRNRAMLEAQDIRRSILPMTVFLLFSGVLMEVLIFYLLAREMTDPIQKLTAAAQQIQTSGTHQHLPIKTKDEIGLLTQVFNQMVDKLLESRKLAEERTVQAKQVAEQLQVAQNQLVQSQKLEAIGTLAGGIAHDFNNLLAAILGYVHSLQDQLAGDPVASRKLSTIEKCAERGTDVTRKLLSFARNTQFTKSTLNLNDLVDETATLLHHSLPKEIQIQIKLDSPLWPIEGDPTQLVQVLMNLAINAKDAMPSGGEIRIQTTNLLVNEPPGTLQGGLRKGHYVRLSMSDSGEGIPKELHDKIFEPFFTTKEIGKGTGLGLSMVYGICKSHGAMIRLTSEPKAGTHFEIFFPALEPEKALSELSPSQRAVNTLDTSLLIGQCILVIEPDPESRARLQEMLEIRGVSVSTVAGLDEALEFCRNSDLPLSAALVSPTLAGTDLELWSSQSPERVPTLVMLPNAVSEDWLLRTLLATD